MKALRVPVDTIRIGDQELDRETSHYVVHVHRARMGMPLVLFDAARGTEADATILSVRGKTATVRVDATRPSKAIPTRTITLIQSIAKGDKLDRIVRDATALGVTKIVVLAASRSVLRIDRTEVELRHQRWTRIAVEAARQSGRGNIPAIVGPTSLDELAKCVADCSKRILLSPRATERLRTCLNNHPRQPFAICIGPEGGFEPEEEALLLSHGFEAVRFGDYVLRTETAATAVLGAMLDWGIE